MLFLFINLSLLASLSLYSTNFLLSLLYINVSIRLKNSNKPSLLISLTL